MQNCGGLDRLHSQSWLLASAPLCRLLLLACWHQRKVADQSYVVGGPARRGQRAAQRLHWRRLQHAQWPQAPAVVAAAAAGAAAGREPDVVNAANEPSDGGSRDGQTEVKSSRAAVAPSVQRTQASPSAWHQLTCRGRYYRAPRRPSTRHMMTAAAGGAAR